MMFAGLVALLDARVSIELLIPLEHLIDHVFGVLAALGQS